METPIYGPEYLPTSYTPECNYQRALSLVRYKVRLKLVLGTFRVGIRWVEGWFLGLAITCSSLFEVSDTIAILGRHDHKTLVMTEAPTFTVEILRALFGSPCVSFSLAAQLHLFLTFSTGLCFLEGNHKH